MQKTLVAGFALAALLAAPPYWGARAEPYGTAEEAVALVKKAVAHIAAQGAAAAYGAFATKPGPFVDRDLYIVVYGLDGRVLAHGANAKLVGKDLSDAQDVDGAYYVRDRIAQAKAVGIFWQDYKFVNPLTKKVAPKRMYCERVDETAVCGGIYKS